MKVHVVLAAGGQGLRLGSAIPKQFLKISGKTLIETCLQTFSQMQNLGEICVVLPANQSEISISTDVTFRIVSGGASRAESVRNGILAIQNPQEKDYVLVHDVARPFVSIELIDRVIAGVEKYGAAIPVVPIADTLKKMKGDVILQTVDRSEIQAAQTPQGALFSSFLTAYSQKGCDLSRVTDEAMLLEKAGFAVHGVMGDVFNFKITTDFDWKLAQTFREEKS